MTAHTPRTFEVPSALIAAGYGPTVDLDALDREVEFPGEFGDWAEKVLYRENTKVLHDICGDMRLLPRGILSDTYLDDGSVLVAGLVDSVGRVWSQEQNRWLDPDSPVDIENDTLPLSDDEVAFVARAFREGADEVWFRPYIPKAFVSAVVAAPPPPQDRLGSKANELPPRKEEVPEGSAIVAVVDPIDEDAVLEMLAIAPGPRVLRRHDGNWYEDPEWVPVLTSVKPPKIVKLDEAQVASVSAQVDRFTDEQDWEPFETGDREQYQIFTASAYLDELHQESQEVAIQALLAVAGRKVTLEDRRNTERLKRYWTIGKGAAKIRWGTPGAWRRCYRHLVKYVGPKIAPGYCTNLSKRLGGPGIATHVTSSSDPVTAANPTGKNGYDSGMTFEEATDGVERDENGRFAPETGGTRIVRSRGSVSNLDDRLARRRASMKRSKDEREKPEREKAEKEREAAAKKRREEDEKRETEREETELARFDLEIARARAAGDKIKTAELRVQRAQKEVEFADTEAERLKALTRVTEAKMELKEVRSRGKSS